MTDVATIRRAVRVIKHGKPPAPPTTEELINDAVERLIPAIRQIVAEQIAGVEYPVPADRTDEVLQEIRSVEPSPGPDLSPLLEAIQSIQPAQSIEPEPSAPTRVTMRVLSYNAQNRPDEVEIIEEPIDVDR